MVYVTLASRCLIGLVFAVSAFTKLRSRQSFGEFAAWLAGLRVLPVRGRPVAMLLAAAEATIVVLVAVPWTVQAGLALAAATLAVLAAGSYRVVRAGTGASCQCFGASRVPLGFRHVVRNGLLCVVAAAGAAVATGNRMPAHPAGIVLSLGAGVVVSLFVLFLDDLAALFAGPGVLSGEGQ